MKRTTTLSFILSCAGLAWPLACSGSDDKGGATNPSGAGGGPASDPDGGGGGATTADAGKPPVRTSCGDVAILTIDYASQEVPDACKQSIDAACCDAATACAADPACMKFRDCWASPVEADCGIEPQTSRDLNDCARKSFPECADLSCAGAPAPSAASDPIQAHFHVVNFLTGAPLPGTTVRVCDRADTECKTPLHEATTGSDGAADFEWPPGAWGTSAYIEITGGDVQPTLWFPRFVDRLDILESGAIGVLDTGTDHALWGAVAASGDPTARGSVTVNVVSCGASTIPGATATLTGGDASTITTYIVGGVPSLTATETDGSGLVSFIDLPPGPTTVTVEMGGKRFGTVDAFVRAGFLSAVRVPPE